MFIKKIIAIVCIIISSGCNTIAEIKDNRAHKICLKAGLEENTTEYTECFIEMKKAQYSKQNKTMHCTGTGVTTFCY